MYVTRRIEYEIIPDESFGVIRRCSGCRAKTRFVNTGKFRVNANGAKLDVWLIYQCEACKHTYNLNIYERVSASSIARKEYERFLCNDTLLAREYGRDLPVFQRNKAEIDRKNQKYHYMQRENSIDDRDMLIQNSVNEGAGMEEKMFFLVIHNPCCLQIRPQRQLADVLELSLSRVNQLLEREEMKVERIAKEEIRVYIPENV